MARVQIGEGESAKIVEIGDENYEPTQADVEEVAKQLGMGGEESPSPEATAEEPKDAPWNPNDILNQEGPALINRIPAANREFLRSLGTKEDKADAYMRGLNNPSKSETFQDQLIRMANDAMSQNEEINKMGVGAQTATRFIGGAIPSAVGLGLDIVTDPKQALLAAMGSRFPSLIKGTELEAAIIKAGNTKIGMPKLGGKLQKPAPAEIDQMIMQSTQEAKDMAAVIARTEKAELATTASNFKVSKNDLISKIDSIEKQFIPVAADKATLSNRGNYVKIAKDISNRFGTDWEKAIANEKVSTQEVYDTLGRVVEKSGLLDRPQPTWSASERKIFNFYEKVGKELPGTAAKTEIVYTPKGPESVLAETGQKTLRLSQVDKELQTILRSKQGTQYTQGDHILTEARQEFANLFGEASPRIKAVRTKYAPELQMKSEFYSIFQPFNRSGANDTTKGINFFSRYANGKLKPDEARFVEQLKKLNPSSFKELDMAIGTKSNLGRQLQKLQSEIPSKVQSIKMAHDEARAKTMMDTESHLSLLQAMKENATKEQASKEFVTKMIKRAAGLAIGSSIAGTGFEIGKQAFSKGD